jgi:hypothetical protein
VLSQDAHEANNSTKRTWTIPVLASETFFFRTKDWWVIKADSACQENTDGIMVSDSFGSGYTPQSCQAECQDGCQAVDFFSATGWCNLYDRPCAHPTLEADGASSFRKSYFISPRAIACLEPSSERSCETACRSLGFTGTAFNIISSTLNPGCFVSNANDTRTCSWNSDQDANHFRVGSQPVCIHAGCYREFVVQQSPMEQFVDGLYSHAELTTPPDFADGRPIYTNGVNYILFYASSGQWKFASDLNSVHVDAGIQSLESPGCPVDVAHWQYWSANLSSYTPLRNLRVTQLTCTEPPVTTGYDFSNALVILGIEEFQAGGSYVLLTTLASPSSLRAQYVGRHTGRRLLSQLHSPYRCESLRVVASRCAPPQTAANGCKSLRLAASRCESLQVAARHRKSLRTVASRRE